MKWLVIVLAALLTLILIRLLYIAVSVPVFKKSWEHQAAQTPPASAVKIVALGDSTVQGIGGLLPSNSFVGRIGNYAHHLTGRPVALYNFSLTGGKVSDVLNAQLAKARSIANPDLILIAIGPNDLTGNTSLANYIKEYQQVLEALPANKVVIATIPPIERRSISETNVQTWNEALRALAAQTHVSIADVHAQIYPRRNNPFLYGGDFFHPSTYAYRFWAVAFEPAVKDILQ